MQFSKRLGYANNVEEEGSIIQICLVTEDILYKKLMFLYVAQKSFVKPLQEVKVDSKIVILIIEKPIFNIHSNCTPKRRQVLP